jgi:hypothetical protein
MDARFEGETFHIDLAAEPDDGEPLSAMSVILRGIAGSMPQLPTAKRQGQE